MNSVPESVLAYFNKPSVATAIDLLLTGKQHKVPDALQWQEVPSFYSACLAARQAQVEYAVFLAQLWTAIWQDGPKGWHPCPPASQGRKDLSIGVENIWECRCFSRRFERDGRAIELYVYLGTAQAGVQLGVWFADKNERPIHGDDLREAGWEIFPEDGTFWTPERAAELSATFDPSPLYAWRDIALGIASAAEASIR